MKETGEAPDFITVDGGEGGTGAAPVSLADRMGMPILHAIPVVDNILREFGVRNNTVLVASGQIAKGDDVAIAIAMGADMVNIARGNLLAEGCIMALRCHTNQCPTGITTQDPRLRRGLNPLDKYVKVANYNMVLQRELLMFMKSAGVATPWQLTRGHLSVVTSPMVEERMDKIHPYADGSNGERNLPLGPLPADDSSKIDRFGPKLIQISRVGKAGH
jgi:glutamate synthase domain-containing protein 2